MLRINIKRTKTKILMLGLVSALVLPMLHLPTAQAATSSCFEGVDDIVDYDSGNTLYAKLKATCDMELRSIKISFADTESFVGIEESTPESTHSQISGIEISDDDLHLQWKADGSATYANISSGENLFQMAYHVPTNTWTFKRNMPITIDYAEYKIGDEIRTEENVNLDSVLTVTHNGKTVLMVTGVEKQEVSYTGGPLVLTGNLVVEDNPAGITADDLETVYYNATARVDQPSGPGDYYAVYSYEGDNYTASLKVPFTIKDYITVSLEVLYGHGEISAPQYVDAGGDLHVDIEPADGYETFWVDYNRRDVTDLLNEDGSLDLTNIASDVKIEVAFRPVYDVTKGDGAEHIIGKEDNLDFVVDKDPDSYNDGIMTIMVDDNYIDMENDVVVNPAAQTITLLSKYLDTLEPGEHQLEIFFFDTDIHGVARATFITSKNEDEGDPILIPDTGANTTKADTGTKSFNTPAIIALLSIATISAFLLKKQIESLKQGR